MTNKEITILASIMNDKGNTDKARVDAAKKLLEGTEPVTGKVNHTWAEYVKKPVVVNAVEFKYTPIGIEELRRFCGSALGKVTKQRYLGALGEAEVCTLEDGIGLSVKHIATEGDFVIKGISGEFYPCKPDIFWKTYEKVND